MIENWKTAVITLHFLHLLLLPQLLQLLHWEHRKMVLVAYYCSLWVTPLDGVHHKTTFESFSSTSPLLLSLQDPETLVRMEILLHQFSPPPAPPLDPRWVESVHQRQPQAGTLSS